MDASTATGVLGVGFGLLLLIWVISGLLVGALARLLLPGPDPMSWLATLGYGIAGSFAGGIAGRLVGLHGRFDFLISIACAAGLIWFFRRRRAASVGAAPTPPGPSN